MNRTVSDIDRVMSIQDRALSCATLSELASEVLAPAADYLDASTSCFLQVSPDGAGNVRFGRTATHNVSQGAHQTYVTHHFRSDPAIAAATRGSGRRPYVFCTADISDYDQLTNSEFYNEFFRPNRTTTCWSCRSDRRAPTATC